MSKGIDQFLSGQTAILTLCEDIRPQARFYPKVDVKLQILYNLLITYFRKQDEVFLKDLLARHREDHKALKMIEFWQFDLKDVKVKIFTFFEIYTGQLKANNERNLGKDFLDLHTLLKERFEVERNYLFPLLGEV